ncbi:MAG: Na+/H+ antiporter NhaA [Rickettsiales bacterium]|nr:Na+/H+ antiporter NhaA [Rickettsiales bacterium]
MSEALDKVDETLEKVDKTIDKMDEALLKLRDFLKVESAGGVALMLAAVMAMILANSPLSHYYDIFLETHLTIKLGGLGLDKPLLLWINDGLMAVFFFLVGMEIKREVLEGELSSVEQAVLPGIAAVGGIAAPAAIFAYFNQHDPVAMGGWAIPAATDIAFALGILALFGKRVPISLKIFLTAVAVMDDLAAIVIIAIFYTDNLSLGSLSFAGVFFAGLLVLNLIKSNRTSIYVFLGLLMWFAVLKSGVHATLAGVILGFLIPHKIKNDHGNSMLCELEHGLHPWVALLVLPVFAFANAGIHFEGMTLDSFTEPLPLGIALGLFAGKQLGIFSVCWLAIKSGLAKMPDEINWMQFYAVCVLCGVGFTMSLFIGSLAFETSANELAARVGIVSGSLLSGLVAVVILYFSLPSVEERMKLKKG